VQVQREAVGWQQWWLRNRWDYLRISRKRQARSGRTASSGGLTPEMKDLVAFLLKGLQDDYWDVRAASAIALGKTCVRTDAVRRALETAVRDDHPSVQESAALALGMLGARQSSYLLRGILGNRRADRGLRATSAVALGLMGDPANVLTLCRAARAETRARVRAAAVVGLGLIDDPNTPAVLLRIATSAEKEDIRALAVTSLGKLGIQSLRIRGRREPLDLARFLARLMQKDRKEQVRRSAAMILGRAGTEASIPALCAAAVRDRDGAVRSFALLSLARVARSAEKRAAVRGFLSKRLRAEKDDKVRCYAALALGLTRSPGAGPALRELFGTAPNPDLRAAAAVGLGLLKDSKALPLLGREIETPRSGGDVRYFSCIAIGLIGKMHAAEYLRAVLESSRMPGLRWAAAMGLALLGDRSSLPLLRKNLRENSRITREGAIRALGFFRDEAVIPVLTGLFQKESSDELRAMCVVSLGMIGDGAEGVPVLRRVSRDFNWLAALRNPAIDFILRAF
jgi:HEAT repeat protein